VRVAVLADIHGNLPALEAVLRDVDAVGVDAVVLNGDIADGPMPSETMDLLATLGDRAVWVRGNGDRWLVDAFDGTFVPSGLATNAPAEFFQWCAGRIDKSQRDRLAALPFTATLYIDGLGPVTFVHATARDDNEFILVDSPLEHYRQAFASVSAATVVVGHTHMPFDRLVDRRRIINPGSVGLAYGHAGAAWALLGPDVTLRRTSYDPDAAAARLAAAAHDMPDIAFYADNARQPTSDADALTAFTETAHQQATARE
jgi:putative phosphoesterase